MKTAKPFSKAAESRLLGAAKEMTAYVEESGLSPDAAIAKVASEKDLPRDWVPLLVQAHNHGRTTYQRDRTGPALLDKLADFPLASTEGVLGIMFPSDILSPGDEAEKTAVADEYKRPPTWAADHYKAAELEEIRRTPMEKSASVKPEELTRDPDSVMTGKLANVSKLAQVADHARQETHRCKMAYLAAMGRLADHFKGDNASTFGKHAYWAEQLFGDTGKHAMAYVQARNRMKVAEIVEPAPDGVPVTSDREPYNLVKDAIDAGAAMFEARKKEAQAEVRRKQAHAEVIRPFVQTPAEAPSHTSGSPNQSSKEGSILGGIGGGLGFNMVRSLSQHNEMPSAQTPSQLAGSLMNDLADPAHEQALRQVQVRAMLNDMLANDEVISGYDPDEVMNAYNEIAALSPRGSEQAAVIRPLLRKRLTAGSVEPFEAQQMADIEKTITQTSVPDLTAKVGGVLNGNPILSIA
jgi:hypothetical protein